MREPDRPCWRGSIYDTLLGYGPDFMDDDDDDEADDDDDEADDDDNEADDDD
jgi:hypothetical protein